MISPAKLRPELPRLRPAPVVLAIAVEADIMRARTAARDLCRALGTSAVALQKVVTISSELARNMVLYGGGGDLSISPCPEGRRLIHVVARDHGPGIDRLDDILAGRYRSRTGLGLGLLGSRRLADRFSVQTGPAGTRVAAEVAF